MNKKIKEHCDGSLLYKTRVSLSRMPLYWIQEKRLVILLSAQYKKALDS